MPVGSHAKGVSLMEAGNWDAAVQAFGQALDTARGDACSKEAQYLAAVRLLKVPTPFTNNRVHNASIPGSAERLPSSSLHLHLCSYRCLC